MAKTAAERQKEYRKNKLKTLDGEQHERLQAIVSIHAKQALERIAKYHGMKQQKALETAIQDFESRILDGLNGEQQTAYYAKKLKAESLQSNDSALQCDGENEPLQSNGQTDLPLQCDTKKKTGRKPKLSALQCDEIRLRHKDGESVASLAKAFGVAQNTIRSAIKR